MGAVFLICMGENDQIRRLNKSTILKYAQSLNWKYNYTRWNLFIHSLTQGK